MQYVLHKIVVEHTDIPQEIFSLRFVKFEVWVTNLCYISFIFYRSLYSVKCDFVLLGRVLYIFCYDLQSFPFDTWGKQFISSKDIKVLFTRKTILPFNLWRWTRYSWYKSSLISVSPLNEHTITSCLDDRCFLFYLHIHRRWSHSRPQSFLGAWARGPGRSGDTRFEVLDFRTSGHFLFSTTFVIAFTCCCRSVNNCKFRRFKAFKRQSSKLLLKRKWPEVLKSRTSNPVSSGPPGPRAQAPWRHWRRERGEARLK